MRRVVRGETRRGAQDMLTSARETLMIDRRMGRRMAVSMLALLLALAMHGSGVAAQAPQGRGQAAPAAARTTAPLDLTGYWVSLITDDWRWRAVTPPKGDVLYIPVTDAARRAAQEWDPAKDEAAGEACRGDGAGGIMRLPGRLHITWDNDNTLKMEIDTGTQTRVFNFGNAQPPAGEATWQGFSVAQWELPSGARGARGRGPAPGPKPGAALRVETMKMRPGYWQKNGVP